MFEAVERGLGPITGLVNSAGISSPKGRVEALTVDDIDRVLRANVVGTILTCRAAVRRMSTGNGGSGGGTVNLSTGSAYTGNPASGVPYPIAPGAVNSTQAGRRPTQAREDEGQK